MLAGSERAHLERRQRNSDDWRDGVKRQLFDVMQDDDLPQLDREAPERALDSIPQLVLRNRPLRIERRADENGLRFLVDGLWAFAARAVLRVISAKVDRGSEQPGLRAAF